MRTLILVFALFATGWCFAQGNADALTSEQRMFAEALMLERQSRGPDAVKAYIRAARAGSGKAARRLAEIYEQGIPGVPRDHAESLKWANAARVLGDDVGLSDEERRKREAERRAAQELARQEAERRERDKDFLPPPRFYAEPYRPQQGVPLFEQGENLERQGKGREAVEIYERAARAGSGKAALRLAEIYDKGIPGVVRDYALSLRWRSAARALGEDVPPAKR
jgi:TPR repeat protein